MIIQGKIEQPPTDMRHVDVVTSALPAFPLGDRLIKCEEGGKTLYFRVWFSRQLKNGYTRIYLAPAKV